MGAGTFFVRPVVGHTLVNRRPVGDVPVREINPGLGDTSGVWKPLLQTLKDGLWGRPDPNRRDKILDVDKTIGVLGGMGPEATATFFELLVLLTPAQKDQDHVKVVIVNDPKLPDRGAYLEGRGESPVPGLIQAARDLERLGADFIVIPCNTAHAFLGELRAAVGIPILDIVEETVAELARDGRLAHAAKVAVMATRATVKLRLYQNALRRHGFDPLEPDESTQRRISDTISNLKGPRNMDMVSRWMNEAIGWFEGQGATALIYGCTELCLAVVSTRLPICDSTRSLAQAAVRAAKADRALEIASQ